MANPAPGFARNPDHTITLRSGVSVAVTFDGAPIATSANAVLLEEKGYPPRAYIPAGDVAAALTQTAKSTHCPFKGDTAYFDVGVPGKAAPNAAWSYPAPFDEMRAIAGHVAFDDRFSVSIG